MNVFKRPDGPDEITHVVETPEEQERAMRNLHDLERSAVNKEMRFVLNTYRNDEPAGGLMVQRGDGQCTDYYVKWATYIGAFGRWLVLESVAKGEEEEKVRIPALHYGFYTGPHGATFDWGGE